MPSVRPPRSMATVATCSPAAATQTTTLGRHSSCCGQVPAQQRRRATLGQRAWVIVTRVVAVAVAALLRRCAHTHQRNDLHLRLTIAPPFFPYVLARAACPALFAVGTRWRPLAPLLLWYWSCGCPSRLATTRRCGQTLRTCRHRLTSQSRCERCADGLGFWRAPPQRSLRCLPLPHITMP